MEYLTDCSRYEVGYLRQCAMYSCSFPFFFCTLFLNLCWIPLWIACWLLCLFRCVFEVDKEKGLVLTEIAENEDIPSIVGATNCEFVVRTYTDHYDL